VVARAAELCRIADAQLIGCPSVSWTACISAKAWRRAVWVFRPLVTKLLAAGRCLVTPTRPRFRWLVGAAVDRCIARAIGIEGVNLEWVILAPLVAALLRTIADAV